MRKIYSLMLTLLSGVVFLAFSTLQSRADVLVQWTFEGQVITPAVGTGTATLVGGTTSTFATGFGGSGTSGWNTSTYPSQGTNSGTAGTQYSVSSLGYGQITVSWYQRHSNTAANRVRLQYTLDGSNWINFDASDANATNIRTTTSLNSGFDNGRYIADFGDSWYQRSADLSAITGINNNPNFGIRIVSEFASGGNYAASNPSSNYATSGTWRFDDVTINGEALGAPTVSTSAVTNITYNSATSGGNVTAAGGSAVTARGVCWSTSPNPTLANSFTTNGSGTGSFVSQLTGLDPVTTYYVRAYATNNNGTAYGNEVTFTTSTAPFPPTVDFSASSTSLVIGQTISFTDLSTNGPTSWAWSFVGGIPPSSNVQNPTGILYSYAGQYTVCLTATNQYGSNTLCKDAYITVNAPVDAQIVITEIMYNPPESGTDSLEFVELYNNGAAAVDLEGFTFSDGIVYTFPTHILSPGAYTLVAVSAQAMQNTFGVTSLQWTSGALSNGGELVKLVDKYGYTVDSVYFDDVLPWDSLADGWGPSLTLCNPSLDNSLGENWAASTEFAALNANGDSIWATPGSGCIIPEPPIANFAGTPLQIFPGESVTFTDLSVGAGITAWEWTFEGGTPAAFSGQTPPPVVYNTLGIYDVSLTVTNEWGSNTMVKEDYISVVVNPGIGEPSAMAFRVSPNPSSGKILIENISGKAHLDIFNLLGEKQYSITLMKESSSLDLSSLKKGIYLLKLTDREGRIQTQKLILN